MDVVLLLADAAQVDPAGKIHALGIGWDQTSSPTAPSAVLVLVQVPWTDTNRKHRLVLQLRDADGRPVSVTTPVGEQLVAVTADFEVGRPPGIAPGTVQTVKLAPTIGPLPLAPNRYEWHAEIDGETQDGWSAPFTVQGPHITQTGEASAAS